MRSQNVKTDPVTMPAGDYLVGDLCYAIDGDWGRFCDALWEEEKDQNSCAVIVDLDGEKHFSSNTKWGDGFYLDQEGRGYPVDAGLIGATPYNGWSIPNGMHMHSFKEDFECYYDNGRIYIGHITIDTDLDPED